ncbi:hypothetical protein [Candidatus Macondimonas diazotrophica]|jgi:hypothetical protein|uniref:Uncharacterized protein n=1 Tax=Candidatus Macondimonas diazotrophica TaxID=2305248 RepID=A0A4Z0F639_9GAMM|nr:hypothetical protein [Candidatus Macondimonas diazotrophica]TFZ81698.1 hypothetical protein E4680_11550 [Candidatus Macondimonas diazotrophica]
MYRLFKNKQPQVAVILSDASRVEFLNGIYITNKEAEIAQLESMAKTKECGVYFDADDTKVSEENLQELRSRYVPVRRSKAAKNRIRSPGIGSSKSLTGSQFQAGVSNTVTVLGSQENKIEEAVKVSGDPKNVSAAEALKNRLASK